MARRYVRPISLVMVVLSTSTAFGCGQAAVPSAGVPVRVLAPWHHDAVKQSQQFADSLQGQFRGTVRRAGALVTLDSGELGQTTIDFSDAPRTGYVRIVAPEVSIMLPTAMVVTGGQQRVQFLGWLGSAVGAVALQVAFAAARALAQYVIDHPGQPFDRTAALKLMIESMAQTAGNSLGLNVARIDWMPLATQIVDASSSYTFAGVAQVATGLLTGIRAAIQSQYTVREVRYAA